jgi:hypothetical protein
MFVGVVLAGFGGYWITKGSCYVCASPLDTARCSKCQCGTCEEHGVLIGIAGTEEQHFTKEWQGTSPRMLQQRQSLREQAGEDLGLLEAEDFGEARPMAAQLGT